MRVLLFTGKGGVGKTTTAAATALRCADAGLRTLVMSTDPAHSLADALDVPLGPDPTEVAPCLSGQQLDAQARLEASWGEIQAYLLEVFDWAGVEAIEAEELAVLPGLDEVFSLTDIVDHCSSGEWDVVVVDCAPTAETLRLLSLPDVLDWYVQRVFPMGRRINKVVGPVLRRVTNLPVASDEVFGASQRFLDRLDGVKDLLSDPDLTSIRLVANPEKVVIAEARRTWTYLSLYGYPVDAVLVNRLLPDELTDPWFDRWRASQATHLAEVRDAFAPIPVLTSALADAEVVGLDRLRAFGAQLWAGHDPAAVLHRGHPLRVERAADDMVLVIELPLAERSELDLARRGDDLLVTAGPHRRRITLPDSLRRREVTGASLLGGELRITFAGRAARPTDLPEPPGPRPREEDR